MSKISELTDGGSLLPTDYLIAVRSGGNVKVQADDITVDQVNLGDNEFIRLGNSQDLTLVHNASNSIINQAGIGDLLIQKAGSTKLTVNSTGIDVTGTVTATGNVGIGVAPATKFDVMTTGANQWYIRNTDGTAQDNSITSLRSGGYSNIALDGEIVQFKISGSEKARIDSGGSVLIGKSTPTDLHNTWNHLIIGEKGAIISENGAGGIDGITLADNVYIDADTGSYAYQTTAAASQITQSGGVIAFSNAGSGSAGAALTPVERMRINSSGNVLIRQTSDAVFDTNASSTVASFYGLQVSSANSTSTKTILGNNSDGNYIGSATTNSAGKEIINGYVRIASTVQTAGLEEGVILFSTKPSGSAAATERMRIDSSGNLLVGRTGHSGYGVANFEGGADFTGGNVYICRDTGNLLVGTSSATGAGASSGLILSHFDGSLKNGLYLSDTRTAAGTDTAIIFGRGATITGSITTTLTTTAYVTSSDYRLKENVVSMSGATKRLKQLKPSRFNFIADPDKTVDGFLAHEVQDIVPEAITGTKDAVDAEGNPEYQGIDQSKLVPLLVATIQELEARIAALES